MQLDPGAVRLHPATDLDGVVNPQIVHDQQYPAWHTADQPAQEADEQPRVQGSLVAHEAHQPAIVDRRDHAAGELPDRLVHHRGLALRRIAAPDLVLVAEAGLIAPVDRRLLLPGTPGKPGIVALQPGRDHPRRALRGARQRLLRREPPTLQVKPHRGQTQPLAQPAPDQRTHYPGGPQQIGQTRGYA
jgi:hypothetical protein